MKDMEKGGETQNQSGDEDRKMGFDQGPEKKSLSVRFKFKSQNPESVQDNDNEREKEKVSLCLGNEGLRICDFCGKSFSSGKALGGHRRAHIQAQKKSQSQTPKTIKKEKERDSDESNHDGAEEISCTECGKTFESKKSLFGHMRTHPERDWRGIRPPNHQSKHSPSSTLSEDHIEFESSSFATVASAVDLPQEFTRWLVKAKRGRKSLVNCGGGGSGAASGSGLNDEEIDLREGVSFLLMLSSRGASTTLKIEENKVDDRQNISTGKTLNRWKSEKGKAVTKPDDDHDDSVEINGEELDDELEINNAKKMMMRKKKKRRRLADLESMREFELGAAAAADDDDDHDYLDDHEPKKPVNVKSPNKYKCAVCDKSFTTHQALGGHRASHNRPKPSISLTDSASPSASAASVRATPEKVQSQSKSATSAEDNRKLVCEGWGVGSDQHHLCDKCNKSFSSGQALGGHKRCHWTATGQADAPVDQTAKKVFDFDLNLPAPEED